MMSSFFKLLKILKYFSVSCKILLVKLMNGSEFKSYDLVSAIATPYFVHIFVGLAEIELYLANSFFRTGLELQGGLYFISFLDT
jgi:hypothetical protein